MACLSVQSTWMWVFVYVLAHRGPAGVRIPTRLTVATGLRPSSFSPTKIVRSTWRKGFIFAKPSVQLAHCDSERPPAQARLRPFWSLCAPYR